MKAMEEEEARTRRISSTSTRVSLHSLHQKRYSQCLAISKLNSEGSTFADEMTPRGR